jgi:F-type H+-transporting ATPase subunit c
MLDIDTIRLMATAATIAIGVIAPAMAIGKIGAAGLTGISRNPEASSKIQTNMILAIAFAEALGIYALVVALIIKFA